MRWFLFLGLLLLACSTPAPDLTRCESPSSAFNDALIDGMTVQGTLQDIQAVRSNDRENMWYVAAKFDGPGLHNNIGLWATSDIEHVEFITWVNHAAYKYAVWGAASNAPAFGVNRLEDGAKEAIACTQHLL